MKTVYTLELSTNAQQVNRKVISLREAHLAREHIATESIGRFRESEEAQERDRGGEVLEYFVSSHKWESVALAREYWLSQCRSERPAWVLAARQGEGRKELLHFYQAMGLHRAHPWQQTLLASLCSHSMARCLLEVIAGHVVIWRSQVV